MQLLPDVVMILSFLMQSESARSPKSRDKPAESFAMGERQLPCW